MSLPFEFGPYPAVKSTWPDAGRHILGTFDENTIVLYQAYNNDIATHAVTHQTFLNCPQFNLTRMTWFKPNFLWMMYRSGWATKPNQTNILAITITREGFEELLRNSTSTTRSEQNEQKTDVRLQWDPDHEPKGDKSVRRAIQLGIKGDILDRLLTEWIVKIEDVTEFVSQQREFVLNDQLNLLQVPVEKVYKLLDNSLVEKIQLDEYTT